MIPNVSYATQSRRKMNRIDMMNQKQAADYLNVSRHTINRMVKAKKLIPIKGLNFFSSIDVKKLKGLDNFDKVIEATKTLEEKFSKQTKSLEGDIESLQEMVTSLEETLLSMTKKLNRFLDQSSY